MHVTRYRNYQQWGGRGAGGRAYLHFRRDPLLSVVLEASDSAIFPALRTHRVHFGRGAGSIASCGKSNGAAIGIGAYLRVEGRARDAKSRKAYSCVVRATRDGNRQSESAVRLGRFERNDLAFSYVFSFETRRFSFQVIIIMAGGLAQGGESTASRL